MAAHLEIDSNGVANVLTNGFTAWHKDGKVWDRDPTFDEAMADTNQDYYVSKRPTIVQVNDNNGIGSPWYEDTGRYVTFRDDKNIILGGVGRNYEVIQNRDCYRSALPLLDGGFAKIKTAGVLREGADAWLMLELALHKMSAKVNKFYEGKHQPFALWHNNHDGTSKMAVCATTVVTVCWNTLQMSLNGKYSDCIYIKHHNNAEEKLQEAANKLWDDLVNKFEIATSAYTSMQENYITDLQFLRIVVDSLLDNPENHPNWNPSAKRADEVRDRYQNKVQLLKDMWNGGAIGTDGAPSAWNAYMVTTEATDHREDILPTRGGSFRTGSLLDGQLREKKIKVFEGLMRICNND